MAPRPDRAAALALKASLTEELDWLPPVLDFTRKARERLVASAEPEFDVLPLAHGLGDVYTLAEKCFERIARAFEGVPAGPEWHRDLLKLMAVEIPSERPPVIRAETARALEKLLKFRHAFRNIYGIRIDPARCLALAERLPSVADALHEDMGAFLRFLDVLAAASA